MASIGNIKTFSGTFKPASTAPSNQYQTKAPVQSIAPKSKPAITISSYKPPSGPVTAKDVVKAVDTGAASSSSVPTGPVIVSTSGTFNYNTGSSGRSSTPTFTPGTPSGDSGRSSTSSEPTYSLDPPRSNFPQLEKAPDQPPMSVTGFVPGSVYDEKAKKYIMPGQSTEGVSYTRGEGAVQEGRLYQTLATRYAAEGLGDPRGLSTTRLVQELNRNIPERRRGPTYTQSSSGTTWDTHAGATPEPPGYDILSSSEQIALKQQFNQEAKSQFEASRPQPTAEQVFEVLKPISSKEFQESGGVAPPGYTRGYPSVVTTNARVNDILANYEAGMIPTSSTTNPGGVGGEPGATTQEPGAISRFADEYSYRVSGPLVLGAYAEETQYQSIQPAQQYSTPRPPLTITSPFQPTSGLLPTRKFTEADVEFAKNLPQTQVESILTSIGGNIRTGSETIAQRLEQNNAPLNAAIIRSIGKVASFGSDITLGEVGKTSQVIRKTAVGGYGATTTGEKIDAALTIVSFIPVGAAFGIAGKAIKGGRTIRSGLEVGRAIAEAEATETIFGIGRGVGRTVGTVERGYTLGREGVEAGITAGKRGYQVGKKTLASGYDFGISQINRGKDFSGNLIEKGLFQTARGVGKVAKVTAPARKLAVGTFRTASRISEYPTGKITGALESLPGVNAIVSGTSIAAAPTRIAIRGAVQIGEAQALKEGVLLSSNPKSQAIINKKGITFEDINVAGNRAELSGYIPEETGALKSFAKTAGYYSGVTGDKKSFEKGVRDYLTEQGITGSEQDTLVTTALRQRIALRIIAARQTLAAESTGNIGGGKSISSKLAREGTTLAEVRAQDYGRRFVFGAKTRIVGGLGEGAVGSFSAITTKPTEVRGAGLYEKKALKEGETRTPLPYDVKLGDTTLSILGGSITTKTQRYQLGKTGIIALGAVTGGVSASVFGGIEEGLVGAKGKILGVSKAKVGEKIATTAGYTADLPEYPGDVYTQFSQPSRFYKPKSLSYQPGGSNQGALSQSLQKGYTEGLTQGRTGTKTQTQAKTQLETYTLQKQTQKEKQIEKAFQRQIQQQRATQFERTSPFVDTPTTPNVFERVPEKTILKVPEKTIQKVPEKTQTTEKVTEETTIFTPPFFPPPVFPGMSGGETGQRGGYFNAPRTTKYQADYQAKVLGQYAPTAGSQSIYTGTERRYLQGPGPTNVGIVPGLQSKQNNPFFQQSKTSNKSKSLMNLNIGL